MKVGAASQLPLGRRAPCSNSACLRGRCRNLPVEGTCSTGEHEAKARRRSDAGTVCAAPDDVRRVTVRRRYRIAQTTRDTETAAGRLSLCEAAFSMTRHKNARIRYHYVCSWTAASSCGTLPGRCCIFKCRSPVRPAKAFYSAYEVKNRNATPLLHKSGVSDHSSPPCTFGTDIGVNPSGVNADAASPGTASQVAQVPGIAAEDVDISCLPTKVAAIFHPTYGAVVSLASVARSDVDGSRNCGAYTFEHVNESPMKRKRLVGAAAFLAVAAELRGDKVPTDAARLHQHHIIGNSDRHITWNGISYEPAGGYSGGVSLFFCPYSGRLSSRISSGGGGTVGRGGRESL